MIMELELKDIKYDYGKFKVNTNKLYTKQELDAFLNDRYTKDQTYSKTELNNIIAASGISGAFDISVSKNNTAFATLSEALGTDGVNVPVEARQPGMSIKFIQSSDNKYVQYRYMGTAITGTPNPFLDTDNWQGVDDEPTEDSQNLVKSGGVYSAIQASMQDLHIELITESGMYFVDEDVNIGAYLDENGFHAKNIIEYEIINQ